MWSEHPFYRSPRKEPESDHRNGSGPSTLAAYNEWKHARMCLISLKRDSMAYVKHSSTMRSQWKTIRRQLTLRIGQLTNDPDIITRTSNEIYQLANPPSGPHPPQMYYAILSSTAKAILLQAETEATASKRSAIPLAQVAYNLLSSLPHFGDIFFAKMNHRVGGLCIPISLPDRDYDSRLWANDDERKKAMGFRGSARDAYLETSLEFSMRVAGIMRVYFHILKIQPTQPLPVWCQTTRYWIWFARILGEPGMLRTIPAAEIIYTALDVMGAEAREMWGYQFDKMLSLIYQGVTIGLGKHQAFFIGGGTSPEVKSARVRVQLEIERIVGVTGNGDAGVLRRRH